MVQKYIPYINWVCVIYWIIGFILILSAWVYLNKSQHKWRKHIIPVLIVILVRMILFDNIASWAFYYKFLSQSDIGFRHHDLINHEIKRFLIKPPEESKYLAVGTSQTGAIYGGYSKKHKDFNKIEMAGLGPLDMYLYRNYIASYKPEYILLYLSEFDLARKPDLNLAKISPNQGFKLIKLWPDLIDIANKYNNHLALKEMILGEFFPEYKYGFIFKGIINKLFHIRPRQDKKVLSKSEKEKELFEHVSKFKKKLNENEIGINFKLLKEFLNYYTKRNIKIVIVEGQYNPLAYDERTLELNKITNRELTNIANSDLNITFIPRAKSVQFNQEDYCDAYHVSNEDKKKIFVDKTLKTITDIGF
jgi:hypothetical protein